MKKWQTVLIEHLFYALQGLGNAEKMSELTFV